MNSLHSNISMHDVYNVVYTLTMAFTGGFC